MAVILKRSDDGIGNPWFWCESCKSRKRTLLLAGNNEYVCPDCGNVCDENSKPPMTLFNWVVILFWIVLFGIMIYDLWG